MVYSQSCAFQTTWYPQQLSAVWQCLIHRCFSTKQLTFIAKRSILDFCHDPVNVSDWWSELYISWRKTLFSLKPLVIILQEIAAYWPLTGLQQTNQIPRSRDFIRIFSQIVLGRDRVKILKLCFHLNFIRKFFAWDHRFKKYILSFPAMSNQSIKLLGWLILCKTLINNIERKDMLKKYFGEI